MSFRWLAAAVLLSVLAAGVPAIVPSKGRIAAARLHADRNLTAQKAAGALRREVGHAL